jgi:DNA replication ATP-dependent helicase Dna2
MRSKEIGDVNTSLFHKLSQDHPESLLLLKKQYRMNEDIMSISNNFIYDNNLQCGNVMVAESKLDLKELNTGLSFLAKFDKSNDNGSWIEKVLDSEYGFNFYN